MGLGLHLDVCLLRSSLPHRPMKRFIAWLFGYFWEECPRCQRMFAGFEAAHTAGEMVDGHFLMCCQRCETKELNENGYVVGLSMLAQRELSKKYKR